MDDTPPPAFIRDDEHPLRGICEGWRQLLKQAQDDKEEKFQKYANEAQKFFDGPHNFMWQNDYCKGGEGFMGVGAQGGAGLPKFRMTCNKLYDAVTIYGPMLYHNNPEVICTPRPPVDIPPEAFGVDIQALQEQMAMGMPVDPMQMQQAQQIQMLYQAADQKQAHRDHTAKVTQGILNWIQHETDKRASFRLGITELIIKGGTCFWTEAYTPPGAAHSFPRTTWDSVDNLLVDPDAKKWEDVLWIARKRCRPKWEVERRYQLPEGTLRGKFSSYEAASMAGRQGGAEYKDLITYWEVWSKTGMGQRFHKMEKAAEQSPVDLEQFGDFTYLVIAEDCHYPLNLPDAALANPEDAFLRVQWPIPFWPDNAAHGWPMTLLRSLDSTDKVWPLGMAKAVMGELRFVNWALSFMADKIAAGAKTLVAVYKEMASQIRDSLDKSSGPYAILEVGEANKESVDKMIKFLESPDPGMSIWNMLTGVLNEIDKRTGLTELMYGMAGTQIRSASEANIRSGNMSIRPDDMAECVETAASQVARKESIAMHWLMRGEDVDPILGPVGSAYYEQFIRPLDPLQFIRDYDIRIEAGTARKPNRAARQEQLTTFGQVAAPMMQSAYQMGDPGPWNAWASDVAESQQLDPQRYLLAPPLPPMPPAAGPPPEGPPA